MPSFLFFFLFFFFFFFWGGGGGGGGGGGLEVCGLNLTNMADFFKPEHVLHFKPILLKYRAYI